MQRAAKVAATDRAALMVTLQAAAPEQAPDQPLKTDRAVAAAVSVNTVPYLKACAHVVPQVIPTGFEVTAPRPFPVLVSVSDLSDSNLAVTARSEPIATVQVPLPEQAPDQPTNVDPAAAVAVSFTGTAPKGAEHVPPQLIPFGLDVTEPVPPPVLPTISELPLKRTSPKTGCEPS